MNNQNRTTTEETTFFDGHEVTQIQQKSQLSGASLLLRYGLPVLTAVLIFAVVLTMLLLPKIKQATNFDKQQKALQTTTSATGLLNLAEAGVKKPNRALSAQAKSQKTSVKAKATTTKATVKKVKPTTTATLLNVNEEVIKRQRAQLVKTTTVVTKPVATKPAVTEPVKPQGTEPPQTEPQQTEAPVDEPKTTVQQEVNEPDPTDKPAVDNSDDENIRPITDYGDPELLNKTETNVTKYPDTHLNLRTSFSYEAKILEVLKPGVKLTEKYVAEIRSSAGVLETWSYVVDEANGQEGYVYSQYLTDKYEEPAIEEHNPDNDQVADDFTEVSGDMYVNSSNGAYMRSKSDVGSSSITILYYGQKVSLLGKGTNSSGEVWYKVSCAGKEGFIRSDLLQTEAIDVNTEHGATDAVDADEVSEPDTDSSDTGRSIASMAMQYLGDAYDLGGAEPGRFDCSGLVWYVYRSHGISIPRTADTQATVGTSIPFSPGDYSQLKAGDIVTFAYAGQGVHHSGIYIGDGKFIHASDYGVGVIISSLSSDYYINKLYSVRRVVY